MKNSLRTALAYTIAGATLYASSFITWSTMLGGTKASFSLANIAWPIVGAFLPFSFGASALGLLVGLKAIGFSGIPLMSVTFGLPTLASMAIWNNMYRATDLALRTIVPLSCLIAFVAHPVGAAASAYTMYWLIPVLFALAGHHGFVTRALSATFVAHAIGSVMYLYTVQTTSDLWLSLIPVVAIERLSFALITAGMYFGIRELITLIEQARSHEE
jgi:hypothetical protein